MKIPTTIEKCPIMDSIVELRFETNIFQNAVFGVLYNNLKLNFPKVEKLPILQLPEQVLENDPAFKYKSHYKLINTDNYSIQIGPKVLVIGCPIPYNGWSEYKAFIYKTLESVFNVGIITKVNRLGIRVINLFDEDIFQSIKLNLQVGDFSNELDFTTIRTQVNIDDFTNTMQIAKNVEYKKNNTTQTGTLLDIDTYKEYADTSFINNYQTEIEKAHKIEKKLFFSLLKEKFIESLEPKYE